MTDWGLATQIFLVGVGIVMFVMFMLQVSISTTSVVVRLLEKKSKSQKVNNS